MSSEILQWNCRGLIGKWAEVKPMLLMLSPLIICLQETHFLPNDPYNFNLVNYSCYNAYAGTGARQGGVTLYVSNKLPHYHLALNTQLQAVACVCTINRQKIIVCSLYLPPGVPLRKNDLDSLVEQFNLPFIICSDANSKNRIWGAPRNDARGNIWGEIIRERALHVMNNGNPTRLDEFSGNLSHIDITICSSALAPSFTWSTNNDCFNSDHFVIHIGLTQNILTNYTLPIVQFNTTKADWAKFHEKCDVQIELDSVDRSCKAVSEIIMNAAENSVPHKKQTYKYNCPWWTSECRRAVARRKRALNRFRRNRTNSALLFEYKRLKAMARRTIRQAKKKSWETLLATFTVRTPLTRLWSLIKCFSGKRYTPPAPIVLQENGTVISDPHEVGNSLGQFFSGISSSNNYSDPFRQKLRNLETNDHSSYNHEVYNTGFTLTELKKALAASGSTSVGPDGIHYDFLKHLPPAFLRQLLDFYNMIWQNDYYPPEWRHSFIVPICKPGKSATSLKSYRPIQLTSCLGKTFERMITKRIMWFVEKNKMLNKVQCGFRKNKSTTDHLIRLESDVRKSFFEGKCTVAIFLDIKSAYNMVNKRILMNKLFNLGFRGHFMNFVQGYLSDRTFQIKTQVLSDIFPQYNGVVQGGVISPLLFLLMINDVFDNLPEHVSNALYADDCSLWVSHENVNNAILTLQYAVSRVSNWANNNGFSFSAEKSQVIIFKRKIRHKNYGPYNCIKLGNAIVEFVTETRFLGMILDEKLAMKSHILHIKARAEKRISVLKCISAPSFGADRKTLLRIYSSLIRPILEYGCQIFDGANDKIVESLESVQNASIRIALGALRTTPVKAMLVEANLPSLQDRRHYLTVRYYLKAASDREHPCQPHVTTLASLMQLGERRLKLLCGIPISCRIKKINEFFDFTVPSNFGSTHEETAPWDLIPIETFKLINTKQGTCPVEVHEKFIDLLFKYVDYKFMYTDGSKMNGKTGCAIHFGYGTIEERITDDVTICTAELFAIFRCLQFIKSRNIVKVIICVDSLSAIQKCTNTEDTSPISGNIRQIYHDLIMDGFEIKIVWIPSHQGIPGNDMADKKAKMSLRYEHMTEVKVHYSEYYSQIKKCMWKYIDKKWQRHTPPTNLKMIKKQTVEWMSSYRENRRDEVILARLRLGHTRLTHRHLMEREAPPICDECDVRVTVEHVLLHCPKFQAQRRQLQAACVILTVQMTLETLLGNDERMFDHVVVFLKDCDLYRHI